MSLLQSMLTVKQVIKVTHCFKFSSNNIFKFECCHKILYFRFTSINPFASIVRTSTSKGKVKVRDICLNISFLT